MALSSSHSANLRGALAFGDLCELQGSESAGEHKMYWRCASCQTTTNDFFQTCNKCGAPREFAAPSSDGYVENTVLDAQPRSAEELREVAARLLRLAEEKEGGAAPVPAAAPTAGGSSSEESEDEGAPAPAPAPAAPPTAGGSSSDDSDDEAAPAPAAAPTAGGSSSEDSEGDEAVVAPATPAADEGPTKRPRGSPEEPILVDDGDEPDSKRLRRGDGTGANPFEIDDSDDDSNDREERDYLARRTEALEKENEELRSRLAAPGQATQIFDGFIHADDDGADARRCVRRASECVRSFIVCERRVEDILRLSGGAAQCRGGRTKLGRQLDVIGAPRSLRENLFRLKGLRNAAAHEVDCERIAATTDDDLAGLIRDIDRDLKALEASAGARRVTR